MQDSLPPHQELPCRRSLSASIILLHGYAAHAELNLGDGESFVDDHTEVLLPDAPGHGSRRDGTLERIGALPDRERSAAIHDLAARWVAELAPLAASCRSRGARRVGLVGISMGGLSALGALAQPCPFDAVAAILASPALVDRSRITAGAPPLLLGVAGRDAAAPPEPSRRFAADYGAELHEYPDSEHLMRPEDWNDLWQRTASFFRRQLGEATPRGG